jgi:hypothetical protein
MTDIALSPVYVLRNYVWDVIKTNVPGLDEADYGGLIPIVPVMEEPELAQYSGPYMVYGYVLSPTGGLHAIKKGSMSFVVYSQNFGTLTKITNLMEEALGRQDESAADINRYSDQIPRYKGISFGEVHTALVEGGSPESDEGEGGRQSAIVSVTFTYFMDFDIDTNPTPSV